MAKFGNTRRTRSQEEAIREFIHDEIGRRKAVDGEFYTPWAEQDGQWVERSDIEWDRSKVSENEDLSRGRHAATVRRHRQLAPKLKNKSKGRQFEAHGVKLLLLEPVVLTQDDALETRVLATDTSGNVLDVDDGWFRIWNPPVDTTDGLLDIICMHVARENGMT